MRTPTSTLLTCLLTLPALAGGGGSNDAKGTRAGAAQSPESLPMDMGPDDQLDAPPVDPGPRLHRAHVEPFGNQGVIYLEGSGFGDTEKNLYVSVRDDLDSDAEALETEIKTFTLLKGGHGLEAIMFDAPPHSAGNVWFMLTSRESKAEPAKISFTFPSPVPEPESRGAASGRARLESSRFPRGLALPPQVAGGDSDLALDAGGGAAQSPRSLPMDLGQDEQLNAPPADPGLRIQRAYVDPFGNKGVIYLDGSGFGATKERLFVSMRCEDLDSDGESPELEIKDFTLLPASRGLGTIMFVAPPHRAGEVWFRVASRESMRDPARIKFTFSDDVLEPEPESHAADAEGVESAPEAEEPAPKRLNATHAGRVVDDAERERIIKDCLERRKPDARGKRETYKKIAKSHGIRETQLYDWLRVAGKYTRVRNKPVVYTDEQRQSAVRQYKLLHKPGQSWNAFGRSLKPPVRGATLKRWVEEDQLGITGYQRTFWTAEEKEALIAEAIEARNGGENLKELANRKGIAYYRLRNLMRMAVPPKRIRAYTAQEKEDALEKLREAVANGESMAGTAVQLDIPLATLTRWHREKNSNP